MKIRIERVSDIHECEVCGDTWAEGAIVYIDDQVTLDLVHRLIVTTEQIITMMKY